MHYPNRLSQIAVAFALLCSPAAQAQTITGTCLPNDEYAQRLVSFFQQIVTPTNSHEIDLKKTLGLSKVSSSQVSVANTASACTSAAVAVDKVITTKRANYPLYVIALGPSFGVSFATEGSRAPGFAYVFDRKWHFKAIVLTF